MITSFGELFNLSPLTLIIILVILLLLFGAKKLPELAKSFGESAKELRKGLDGTPENTTKKDSPKETAEQKSSKPEDK